MENAALKSGGDGFKDFRSSSDTPFIPSLYHQNLKASIRYVLDYIAKKFNYSWKDIQLLNDNRYAIAYGTNPGQNILITYKREVFFNFSKQFNESGVGDSINKETIKTCVMKDIKIILAVFPNDNIYHITLKDFMQNSHRWINKEGKEVFSISIHRYNNIEKVKGLF